MKYHLIGDQGVSMRGIRKYLEHKGKVVSGSDLKTGGHKKENVSSDVDVVVRTSAVSPSSEGWVEVEAAKKLGIKILKRSELLGELTKDKELIAVSGMHGKTTVTSMIGLCLVAANFDPTVLVGEDLTEFGGVLRFGKSSWFVMEACEYDRAFLDFYPKILVLTNIEEEHLDTYSGGLPEIKKTFIEYIDHVPDDGLIVACEDDDNIKDVLSKVGTKAKVIYYGFSSSEYKKLDFNLSIPGKHNVLNALAAVALCDYLKIDRKISEQVLKVFKGAHRRFENKGNFNGADLVDDYGHHPTEIKSTLEALSEKYPNKKKIVVFWPHQYKRIKPFLNDFAQAFNGADEIIIKPIFLVPGRDEKLDVDSKDIVDLINAKNNIAKFYETDAQIVEYLSGILDDKSVLLTIGIPPVYRIEDELLKIEKGS
ncbi:MAG: UDP-N-acetylmuramate--L-alanine ligase [Patescibacteria group bacterium]|nr:UDP-N-acetylmuramate--L-alanine ligase [Patescibacteria group bacterium]